MIPDRLVSLADPDARPIRKGKPGRPTEFGYTLLLAEDERGFVADHQLAQGNPPDAPQLLPTVERVIAVTGRAPGTVVGDRGFGTAANDQALAELGVRRIGLQRKGRLSPSRAALERTRAFRRLRNWRVGTEARIIHLKRSFGLRRTRLRRLGGCPGSANPAPAEPWQAEVDNPSPWDVSSPRPAGHPLSRGPAVQVRQ